jgi:hypothetical protein
MVRPLLSLTVQHPNRRPLPFMVLAIAALALHLLPAADTRAAADATATIEASATSALPAVSLASSEFSSSSSPSAASIKPASDPENTNSLASTSTSTQSFSNIRLPDPEPAKPVRFISVHDIQSRKSWLVLSFVQHGAAAFDAYSTRQAIAAGAHEDDSLMRPFAHSPAIYFASQAGPLALDYAARRMQRSQSAFLRRTWWLPQSASTGLFILSGVHNLHVANHP